jgi:23S rRNA (pseudouridine1915-N3)-methyltransferase
MKVVLLTVGATDSSELLTLIRKFEERIARYIPFEIEFISDVKVPAGKDSHYVKAKEAEQLLKRIQPQDLVWLLDENGKTFDSRGLAAHIQKGMNSGPKRLICVIGGAYGFDASLRKKANDSISLSKLTFNHQVVRLMTVEQLYRAFSILKGDPYHND